MTDGGVAASQDNGAFAIGNPNGTSAPLSVQAATTARRESLQEIPRRSRAFWNRKPTVWPPPKWPGEKWTWEHDGLRLTVRRANAMRALRYVPSQKTFCSVPGLALHQPPTTANPGTSTIVWSNFRLRRPHPPAAAAPSVRSRRLASVHIVAFKPARRHVASPVSLVQKARGPAIRASAVSLPFLATIRQAVVLRNRHRAGPRHRQAASSSSC